ncbi:hypothetical protein fugu_010136 [Takifugu bimaculatus]|uniref:Microfibril associated protein 5 n=1 Tax=Takifugu bimaculatus TaxID=433685 RepID=A0A4Z2CEP2_9TELE|nr:hypothetical protein fugu_010136 [Takifugu bimaculatus]
MGSLPVVLLLCSFHALTAVAQEPQPESTAAPAATVPPNCREEMYPCTRMYSVHRPIKQCVGAMCFYSLPRVYVINKEICMRTVCPQDEYRKESHLPESSRIFKITRKQAPQFDLISTLRRVTSDVNDRLLKKKTEQGGNNPPLPPIPRQCRNTDRSIKRETGRDLGRLAPGPLRLHCVETTHVRVPLRPDKNTRSSRFFVNTQLRPTPIRLRLLPMSS